MFAGGAILFRGFLVDPPGLRGFADLNLKPMTVSLKAWIQDPHRYTSMTTAASPSSRGRASCTIGRGKSGFEVLGSRAPGIVGEPCYD